MKPITSLQNPKIKLTRALLKQSKARRKEREIVLEGNRLVRDACERGYRPVSVFYESQSADIELINFLRQLSIEPIPVSVQVIKYVTDSQHPQGIVGVFPMPELALPEAPEQVLILDAIRDPGNLGTILRTAAAAGIQAVLLGPGCAEPYHPKALRGGMGAHFRVPVIALSWEQIAAYCEPLIVYLADSNGSVRYDSVNWSLPWALIIGSEAHGTGIEAEHIAKAGIYIPMVSETESLNAAVATGILLFEATRKQRN